MEYRAIVKNLLQYCLKHVLAVNLVKIKFYRKSIIFLEYVINSEQIKMDPAKLKMMFKYPIPTKT